jgi:tetratricopeptide (TPR) repeat protein
MSVWFEGKHPMKWWSAIIDIFAKLLSFGKKTEEEKKPARPMDELLALVEQFKKQIRKNPLDGMGHYNLGDVYIELKRFKEALDPLKEAIRINPKHSSAYYLLGRTQVELGRDEEAIVNLQESLSLDDTSDATRRWLAMAHTHVSINLRKARRVEDSIRHIKAAIKVVPDYGAAYLSLGICYADLGRYKEALDNIDRSLKLDNNLQVDAHYEAGLIYTKLGEDKKAIKEYQQAIAVSPKAPMPQLKLGLLFAKMKKFEDAVGPLQQAIKLSPSRASDGFFKLGLVLKKLGRLVEGVEHLRKARELSPNNLKVKQLLAESLYLAGVEHLKQKQLEEALTIFKEAVECDPKHVMTNYRLALVYDKFAQGYYAIQHMTIAKLFFAENHQDEWIAKALKSLDQFYKKYPYKADDFKKVRLPE